MKLLALTINSTGQNGVRSYSIPLPSGLSGIDNLPLQRIISNGITLLLYAVIILALIFVIVGGLKWIMSQGDKKQIEEAQHTITYAIIGLIVAFLAFFIVNLIGYAFTGQFNFFGQ